MKMRRLRSDFNDLTGRRFGKWLVKEVAARAKHGCTLWRCVCDCGVGRSVQRWSLVSGASRSCGCIRPNGSQWSLAQHRASKKKWRDARPDYRAKESRRWRAADPERSRRKHREQMYRSKYGIEVAEAEAMLASQGGLCAICTEKIILGGRSNAKVDHDHKTGRVRGILCSRCNTGLGHFKDDPRCLASAIQYLRLGDEQMALGA